MEKMLEEWCSDVSSVIVIKIMRKEVKDGFCGLRLVESSDSVNIHFKASTF